MTTVFKTPHELEAKVGTPLGTSEWLTIDQQRINLFADATGDHQWIHVDPEKAKDGPFGATIAHGYLTLSLVSKFLPEIVDVQGISMGVNYGLSRLQAMYLFVRSDTIYGGTNQIQRNIIAERGLGMPKEPRPAVK